MPNRIKLPTLTCHGCKAKFRRYRKPDERHKKAFCGACIDAKVPHRYASDARRKKPKHERKPTKLARPKPAPHVPTKLPSRAHEIEVAPGRTLADERREAAKRRAARKAEVHEQIQAMEARWEACEDWRKVGYMWRAVEREEAA